MRREGRPAALRHRRNGTEKPSVVRCAEETVSKNRPPSAVRRKRAGKPPVVCRAEGALARRDFPVSAQRRFSRRRRSAAVRLRHRHIVSAVPQDAVQIGFSRRIATRAGARDHRKIETICRIKPLYHTAPGKSRRDRPHVFAEAAANDRPHAKKRPKSIFFGRLLFCCVFCICYYYLISIYCFFAKNRSFLHVFAI